MSKPSQTRLANSRKALIGSSVAALGYALLASAPAAAQTASANASIVFPSGLADIAPVQISINGADLRLLGYNFTTDSSLPGYIWNGTTVQSTYNSDPSVLQIGADITSTPGAGGIFKQLTDPSWIADPADISLNTIAANAYGNNALPGAGSVTFDLGLLSTNGTAGTLIVQYTGNEQSQDSGVSITSELSNQFVGVDYTGQTATELAVNGNQLAAQSALNTATTLVAGAVPLSYDTSGQGGSSTISIINGEFGISSSSSVGLNTIQGTQNAGISSGSATGVSGSDAGSYAMVTGSSIAVASNVSSGSLTAPITLNSNAIAAQFTGNSANSVFESASSGISPTNEFNGTVGITNAQANIDYIVGASGVGVNALVSDSNIVADLTYNGISSNSGTNATTLAGSLSVSGTAQDPQMIAASAIGNLAGSVTGTGEINYYGNAISFTDSSVNLNGSDANATGVWENASSGGSASADLLINNLQANATNQGVSARVENSLVYAAVDSVSSSGSITTSYNEVTSQVAGNAVGNLIDVAANNVGATMAVANNQVNSSSGVGAATDGSGVLIGIGAANLGAAGAVGNLTADNNLVAATAQGNLAANTISVDVGNTMYSSQDQVSGGFGGSGGFGISTYADAGLVASNLQTNIGTYVDATVTSGGVKIDLIDQAGGDSGTLVALGGATVNLAGNAVAAKAEGNVGSTSVTVNDGTDLALTVVTMNAQQNLGSGVTAAVNGSDVLVTALSTDGTILTAENNAIIADATGNSAINSAIIAGANVVNTTVDRLTDVYTGQYNTASVNAGISGGTSIGLLAGEYSGVSNASVVGFTTIANNTVTVGNATIASTATGNAAANETTVSGTTLGNEAAIYVAVGGTQDNSAVIGAGVESGVIGVELRNQVNSITLVSGGSDADTLAASGGIYSGSYSTISATATNAVSGSNTTAVTGITGSTIAVNDAVMAAQATGNSASNSSTINGATVTVISGGMEAVDNTQVNSGSATALVKAGNIGVTISPVSGTSSLSRTSTANASATAIDSNVYNAASADASSTQNASGSTTVVAVNGLNATTDGAQVLAAATGNTAANSLAFSATAGAPTLNVGNGLVSNWQSNEISGSASIQGTTVGLEIASVTAVQTVSVSGSASATLAIDSNDASATANNGDATAYGYASGSATATGQIGGGSTVTDALLSAATTGNRVLNTVAVDGTDLSGLNFTIDNQTFGQFNDSILSAELDGVNVGTWIGNVGASGSATVKETATLSSSATAGTTASASGGFASGGGSAIFAATATGISLATNNTSRNALGGTVSGNDATNRIEVNATSITAAAGDDMLAIANGQSNYGSNNATVVGVNVGSVLGNVAASGSASVTLSATASGDATQYDAFSGSATATANAQVSGSSTLTLAAAGVKQLTDTIADNSIKSITVGNNAANTIAIDGTNVTGTTATSGSGSVPGINNSQSSTASQTAQLDAANVGLIIGNVLATGSVSVSGSAATSLSATNTPNYSGGSGSFSTEVPLASAQWTASGSASSVGISGSNVTVAGNALIAGNSGNVAANRIAASSTTLNNLAISNSNNQSGSGTLTATVGEVDAVTVGLKVGVNVGSVSADMIASVSGTATVSGGQASGASTSSWTDAYARAIGLADSTFSVTSNNVSALNFVNDAANSVVLETSVLGAALLPTSVSQSNSQNAAGSGANASVLGLELGVVVGNVSASADNNGGGWTDVSAVAVGMDTVDVTVGGTPTNPQVVRAQSVGNNAANAIITTDTTGTGTGTAPTLQNTSSQDNWASYTARVGDSGDGTLIGAAIGDVSAQGYYSSAATGIFDSNVNVAYNQVDALAFANSVNNLVSASSSNTIAGNTTGNTIVNSNEQFSASGSLTTAIVENLSLGMFVGDVTGTGAEATTISVVNNAVSAAAYGNGSDNLLGVDAQVVGSGSAPISTLLYNGQSNSGGRSATVTGVRLGLVTGTTSGYGLLDTSATVDGNALAAETFGNSAKSASAITADNTIALSNVLTSNVQNNSSGSGSSTLSDIFVGTDNGTSQFARTIADSIVSVSENALTSRSIGNYADSRTSVAAGNSISAGSVSGDYAIASLNDQTGNANLTATATGVTIGSHTDGGWRGILRSPVTVSGNSLAIIAAENLATTVATAASNGTIANTTGASNLILAGNTQDATGVVSATGSTIDVGTLVASSDFAINESAVTTSGNSVEAMATGNAATTVATLAAATTLDGTDDANVNDALVTSDQTKSGGVTASLTGVRVGMMVDAGLDIQDSNLTVDGNTVSAMARGNVATNQLAISAQQLGTSTTSVKGAVSNAQSNSASGSASLNNISVGLAPLSDNAVDTDRATIAATNNALNAVAGGNTAANVLNATATATIAAAEGYGFRVLNSQSNSAEMTASATNTKIGTWSGGGEVYGRTTTTVSYNTLNVAAYGNSAINALNVSALNGSQSGASGAVQNSQQSYANISATVQNAQIGSGATYAGGGAGGVISNSINATATGNIANTSIGIVR